VPKRNFLVATFTDADSLLRAVVPMRSENFRIYDVYAPYPVHGLDEAMGLRRTRLPWVTAIVGLLGLTFALTFQYYAAVFDWPLNVGGKPDNTTLAFIPICFELTVLFGGLATVLALLVRSKLYPGKRERLIAGGITNNTFALVVRKPDESFDTRRACKILEDNGANEIEEKEAVL
jgi:hypothetical protein